MIVSPTLKLGHTYLAMVEEGIEWKATWERLEIKFHRIGMKWLDLNT
jgi:hypothetical protein